MPLQLHSGILIQILASEPKPMSQRVKAAAIQMASGPNLDANLLEARRLIRQAAEGGAQLVVLPENFAFMGARCSEMVSIAEPAGEGQIQEFLSEQALTNKVWIVGGTTPLISPGQTRVRSACLIYDDKGELRGRYDKIHLFDVQLVEVDEEYSESKAIEPGESSLVIDTPFGRLGVAICYDLRFPELFRELTDKGAELIALPAAFTAATGQAHWDTLVRARAIENLCFLVASAQGGFHVSGRETYGHSMIIDPWGTTLANREGGAGVVSAELDFDFLSSTRHNFPSLSHRRLHQSRN